MSVNSLVEDKKLDKYLDAKQGVLILLQRYFMAGEYKNLTRLSSLILEELQGQGVLNFGDKKK